MGQHPRSCARHAGSDVTDSLPSGVRGLRGKRRPLQRVASRRADVAGGSRPTTSTSPARRSHAALTHAPRAAAYCHVSSPRAGPTLTDLTFDESLDDVGRCVAYSCSSIALQRLVHAKLLADAARGAGCVAHECGARA
jgi:hypothetical protein